MAEGAGLLTSPHGPASPVGNVAAAHVCATMANFNILEFSYGEVPWRAELILPPKKLSVAPCPHCRAGLRKSRSTTGLPQNMQPLSTKRATSPPQDAIHAPHGSNTLMRSQYRVSPSSHLLNQRPKIHIPNQPVKIIGVHIERRAAAVILPLHCSIAARIDCFLVSWTAD